MMGGESEKTIEAIRRGQANGKRLYSSKGVASAGKILRATLSHRRDHVAWREFTEPAESIKVMSIEGGDARIVLQPNDGASANSIAWAPDGHSVLVSRSSNGPPVRIVWIAPLDGRAAFKSQLSASFLQNLSVHPDGKTVFFQAGNRDPRIFRTENYVPSPGGTTE